MTAVRDDLFNRFSHSFERWKNLARPTGNLTDAQAPTYPIELALDHIASHLLAVGNDAAGSSTKIDWPKIVPENLADLDAVPSFAARDASAGRVVMTQIAIRRTVLAVEVDVVEHGLDWLALQMALANSRGEDPGAGVAPAALHHKAIPDFAFLVAALVKPPAEC